MKHLNKKATMQRPNAGNTSNVSSGGSSVPQGNKNKSFNFTWKSAAILMIVTLIPWAVYVNFHPTLHLSSNTQDQAQTNAFTTTKVIHELGKQLTEKHQSQSGQSYVVTNPALRKGGEDGNKVSPTSVVISGKKLEFPQLPVQGPIPTNGAKPLFGIQHKGTDAIFALACNYPKVYYQRFVGSLRKFGYTEDIVLAVSPIEKQKKGVKEYLIETNVVAYGFDVDCQGTDNCKLKDDFLGYPDPRPHRTFANIRYALYEYWLRNYHETSYILILDFRDTFFQANPFAKFGSYIDRKKPVYDLQMYAENYDVKNIGICVFNSNWVKTCFGKEALVALKHQAVICSGSTLGSYPAIHHYVRTMLSSMDTVKCWLKGIESDQGYQNYLFYNGHFNTPLGNATLFHQGHGVVNTIGAMNGFR